MDQNTVFISYRRAISKYVARSIYMDLKGHGWDVFLDVNTIDSGDFDRIILNQIGARAHFILLISPDSLARCANAGDWVLREIQEAVRLQRNIVPIVEEGADFGREMGYLPPDLRAVVSKKNALPLMHFYFDAGVEMLRTRFLKAPEYIAISTVPVEEHVEVKRRMASVEVLLPPTPSVPTQPRVVNLLPNPFGWIQIPAGKVTLVTEKGWVKNYIPEGTSQTFDVPALSIAKYPLTNGQYATFVDAGGYQERRWWTDAGWAVREKESWTQPRYWTDAKWNQAEYPVVGVSWFEAIAFCRWLSESTGEVVSLPTEQQWQRAAQGNDNRDYPWGKSWDASRCNNNVDSKGAGQTTPVRQYEGKGNSPFGVVDLSGNVWEWCLTGYDNDSSNITDNSTNRVLRGGSWFNTNTDNFRCAYRTRDNPGNRNNLRVRKSIESYAISDGPDKSRPLHQRFCRGHGLPDPHEGNYKFTRP